MGISQSYFSNLFSKVSEIKEKTISTMLNDNGVDLENSKENMDLKGYILTHERWNNGKEIIRLIDRSGEPIDGYEIAINFSREGVRVEVVKL